MHYLFFLGIFTERFMLSSDRTFDVLVTCPPLLYPWLQQEIREAGLPVIWAGNTGVETRCSFSDAIRLNLILRCGHRVLLKLAQFECTDPRRLYHEVYAIAWHELIGADGYLCVTSTVSAHSIRDSRYPNVKVKDAIVDRILHECGRRPDSGPRRDRTVVHLYWKGAKASIYIDMSGEPLSRRNYRKMPGSAPLQETLAAAILMASRWDRSSPFINPMCGSGTLAIEAALIAEGRHPGCLRTNFGFMHLKNFDASVLRILRKELKARPSATLPPLIIASDIDPAALEAARQNARTAGVEHRIDFRCCDFSQSPVARRPATIILNPAYGVRLGNEHELVSLYKRIGVFFKEKCAGCSCFVFSGNPDLVRHIGLTASETTPFWNARIKCRLYKYLPQGSFVEPTFSSLERTRPYDVEMIWYEGSEGHNMSEQPEVPERSTDYGRSSHPTAKFRLKHRALYSCAFLSAFLRPSPQTFALKEELRLLTSFLLHRTHMDSGAER